MSKIKNEEEIEVNVPSILKRDGIMNSNFENENIPILNYAFVLVNKTVHKEKTEDKYMKSNIKMLSLFDLNDFGLNYD